MNRTSEYVPGQDLPTRKELERREKSQKRNDDYIRKNGLYSDPKKTKKWFKSPATPNDLMGSAGVIAALRSLASHLDPLIAYTPWRKQDLSPSQKRDMDNTLVNELEVGGFNPFRVYDELYVLSNDISHKFHFFGIYECDIEGKKVYVGGNAYGRIGSKGKAIEIARGDNFQQVRAAVRGKESEKEQKGYQKVKDFVM